MRCEAEITAALQAGEAELCRLSEKIARLQLEVKLRSAGWRNALEALQASDDQRRALTAQLDSLRWVLSEEQERLAG